MTGRAVTVIIIFCFITGLFLPTAFGTNPVLGVLLSGQLSDSSTGEPVFGTVTFILADGTVVTVATTEDGEITARLAEGEYQYVVEAKGYQRLTGTVKVSGEQTRLAIEMDRLDTSESGYVTGRVLTEDGKGIPNAKVVITEICDLNSRSPAVYSLMTGDEGGFKTSLPFTGYWVRAEARGFEAGEAVFNITSDHPRAEVKIILTRISTNETKIGIVHIMVKTENGRGIPGANVLITPLRVNSEMGQILRVTGDDGTYTNWLVFGLYSARAEARGFQAGETEFNFTSEMPEIRVEIILLPLDDQPEVGIVRGFVFAGNERVIDGAVITITPLVRDVSNCMDNEMRMAQYPDSDGDLETHSAVTDESGMFSLRLPFGVYMAVAEARGFEAGRAYFKISSDDPETMVVIALTLIKEGDEKTGRTVCFEMIDRNSDGHPERILLIADLDGQRPAEVYLEIFDENSDGIPERTVFEMNLEPRLLKTVIALIKMYLSMNGQPLPLPGGTDPSTSVSEDGTIYIDDIGAIIKQLEEYYGTDADNDEDIPTDMDANGNADDPISDKTENDDTIAPKGSSNGSSIRDILMSIGIISILLGVIGIIAFASVRRNRLPEFSEE